MYYDKLNAEGIMKKLLIILGILIFGNLCFAQDTVLTGGVDFNWVNMTQIERDAQISEYQNLIFGDEIQTKIPRKEFRAKYKDFLKDEYHKTTYQLVLNGITETADAKLCAFYYKDNIIYMYAIQYKKNPKTVYYYSAFGRLSYVDEMSDNYPDFPYYSKQYRSNGKLAGAIYFISHDLQYVYEPDGTFKGVWYKEKMFDRNAKQILTRTNW